jgi:hypothetical protein
VSFAVPSFPALPPLPQLAQLLGPLQLIGYVACAVSFSSFFMVSHRRFLMVAATGAMLWALHFHLIGERVAAALSALSGGRNTIAPRVLLMPRHVRLLLTTGLCAVVVGLGVAAWNGPLTLLPVFASCLTTTASFWLVGRRFRGVYLVSDSCWLVFGLLAGSAAGTVASAIALCLNLGTIRRVPAGSARPGAEPAVSQA